MKIQRMYTNPDSYRIGENSRYVQDGNCSEIEQVVINAAKEVLYPGDIGEFLIGASVIAIKGEDDNVLGV